MVISGTLGFVGQHACAAWPAQADSGSPTFRIGYFAHITPLQLNRKQQTRRYFNLMGAANCNEGEIDCKHFPLDFEIPCRKAGNTPGKTAPAAVRHTMPCHTHMTSENMTVY
jgi:hypothetical protein